MADNSFQLYRIAQMPKQTSCGQPFYITSNHGNNTACQKHL